MSKSQQLRTIAIEEHYIDPIFVDKIPIYQKSSKLIISKLLASNEERILDMDSSGIDMQILSHNHPGAQILARDLAVETARTINDNLMRRIEKNPDRFGGFATLPMLFPEEAARELERCVIENGFCGAMLHGTLKGEFFDEKKYWGVFETAEKLGKPIYLHPGDPIPAVTEAYYKDYIQDFPLINSAAWGFNVETSTAAVRLILSGIFSKLPNLKIILGHMGEGLPFMLKRCHAGFSTRRSPEKPFIDFIGIFRKNFFISSSGNFSDSALLCSLLEIGANKIMFAVDWPYNSSLEGTNWIMSADLSSEDLKKITYSNAVNVLGIVEPKQVAH